MLLLKNVADIYRENSGFLSLKRGMWDITLNRNNFKIGDVMYISDRTNFVRHITQVEDLNVRNRSLMSTLRDAEQLQCK